SGRFIDKIEVSTHGGMPRAKSGNFAALKRCSSNDKDFHSSRGGPMSAASVQELEGISVVDDEGRLYNETYRSEHSRDDGERYDALGDSPGAQGPSSQGPRSPSVYSQFSQSVFSQSAYGPSAYGPSQRRPSGNGLLGMPGSQIGSSTYDVTSSHAGSGASHYAGPVPSNLGVGASLRSADQTSVSGGGSVVLGYTANNINNHHYSYGNALLGRSVGSGPVGSGPLGSIAGGSAGRRGSGPVAAPPYNPNALPAAAGVNGRLSAGGTGPTRISAGG
ncbi:unnamed protein product, partial [Sphacelaria rigidula]